MALTATGLGRFLVIEEPPQDVHDRIGVTGPTSGMADNMVGVTTIKIESIVPIMLVLGFSLWLEPSVVDLHRGTEVDFCRGITG